MTYNLTAIGENSTTLVGFVRSVNNILMFDWLGVMFLIAIWIIFVVNFNIRAMTVGRSVMTASFLTFVLSALFRVLGLTNDLTVYIFMIITALSIAFAWGTDL